MLTLWDKPVSVKRGQIFQLGQNRLMCGDSTSQEDVTSLLQGKKAQAVISDPPYGTINAAWDKVTHDFIEPMSSVIEDSATAILFCALPYGFDLHAAMLAAGYVWRFDSVWSKVSGGIQVSTKTPRKAHENIFAYARKDAAISSLIFNGWEAGEKKEPYIKVNRARKGDTMEVYTRHSLTFSKGQDSGQRWIRSIMTGREKPVMRHNERTKHPTQKPLETVSKLVLLLTHAGGLVYDPFLGSGTTLIASEKTGRVCYGMELNPVYCQEIIERWQTSTFLEATLAA